MNMRSNNHAVLAAYEECERIVRNRARNFWYGLRLTPRSKRDALHALYAWMRLADDLADDCGPTTTVEERRSGLEELRRNTREIYAGRAMSHEPLWVAFTDMVHVYEPPLGCFEEMIDGQIDDLEWTDCADWVQLREFCYRVASTVGLLCVSIWGANSGQAESYAVDRGIAFQLTNILRDVREDAARGRCYLPSDELREHGLEINQFLAWEDPDRCLQFLRSQIDRAKRHYVASNVLDSHIPADCRASSWAMTRIYKGLLGKIERDPSRIVRGEPVRIGAFRKVAIATQARLLLAGAQES